MNGLSFENVEFVVSGTASELNNLLNLYGSNLSGLADGVTFRVTDGGELTLNAAELDKLSGRIYGTVNVVDSSTELQLFSMLQYLNMSRIFLSTTQALPLRAL